MAMAAIPLVFLVFFVRHILYYGLELNKSTVRHEPFLKTIDYKDMDLIFKNLIFTFSTIKNV